MRVALPGADAPASKASKIIVSRKPTPPRQGGDTVGWDDKHSQIFDSYQSKKNLMDYPGHPELALKRSYLPNF